MLFLRRHERLVLNRWVIFLLVLIVSASFPAVASAKPVVALKLSGAYVEQAGDGTVRLQPLRSEGAKQGERIRWDIVAANTGDVPALALIPVGRIPAGTAFVPGSASTGGRVEYSLDNGKTWSAAPTVIVQTPDGPKSQKADPATYTRIRWVAAPALKPGASVHYTYEVVVK
jgi:uncharacterized repeat protein (TIGR01451 family)